MITLCTTTLQAAARLEAAGLVDQMYVLGRYEDGSVKCLVSLSHPIFTHAIQEVTMSHKTKAAVSAAAQSCAFCCAHYYGDNSTHILQMQEGGEK